MGIRAVLTSLLAVSVLSAPPATAQGLTGTRQVTETGRGSQSVTIELVQTGSELTGHVTMAGGGAVAGAPSPASAVADPARCRPLAPAAS